MNGIKSNNVQHEKIVKNRKIQQKQILTFLKLRRLFLIAT